MRAERCETCSQEHFRRSMANKNGRLCRLLSRFGLYHRTPLDTLRPSATAMFWTFFFTLLAADFIVVFAFSALLLVVVAPFSWLVSPLKNHPRLAACVAVPSALLIGAVQLYFWCGWAAFCSEIAHRFSAVPTVSHRWLYWLLAFLSACYPLTRLNYREARLTCTSYADRIHKTKVGCLWTLVPLVSFLGFALWRDAIKLAFGWFPV
jgi:hypothetical protein